MVAGRLVPAVLEAPDLAGEDPQPAPPTIFDGDWTGTEYEAKNIQIHFIFHMHNTEDGLMVTLDCPEEKFKGALGNKVTYDQNSRQISITIGQAVYDGKMSADGNSSRNLNDRARISFPHPFRSLAFQENGTELR